MPSLQSIWQAAFGSESQPDFQPSQGNKRRIEIYDQLIQQAQLRAEQAGTVAVRRAYLQLIVKLDARCKREVQRREGQARS